MVLLAGEIGAEQVLDVALVAGDRTLATTADQQSGLLERRTHARERGLAHRGVADDAALPHVLTRGLKLRLHQREKGSPRSQELQHGRQHGGHGRERDVAHGQVHDVRAHDSRHVHDVGALEQPHARVLPQLPGELRVSNINGHHGRGAALEQAVGEASCGTAHVEAVEAGGVHAKGGETALELEAPAAHVGRAAAHVQGNAGGDLLPGRGEASVGGGDVAGHDGAQGLVR